MSSTARALTIIGNIANLTNEWVETAGAGALGILAIKNTDFDAIPTPDNPDINRLAPWLLDYIALYGIVRGSLQAMDGIGITWGETHNPKMGKTEIYIGLALVLAGCFYEFAYRSLMPLSLVSSGNAIMKAMMLNDSLFGKNVHPNVDVLEVIFGIPNNLIQGIGFAALAFDVQNLWAATLSAIGPTTALFSSLPRTISKVSNALTNTNKPSP